MVPVRERLDKRYLNGDTISGTRSCHQFEPIASNVIRAKQLSDDKTYLIDNHHFSAMPTAAEIGLTVKVNDYATVLFDGYWWLVLVEEVNMEQKDVKCRFMHPHGPVTSNNFNWPSRNDEGFVPFDKFIMRVDTPKCTSNSGRQYELKAEELKHTNCVYENLSL